MRLAPLLPIMLLLVPPGAAAAADNAYVTDREFISPIGGERFMAQVLIADPPVMSYDYDRCPHAAINALAYTLVIDPATGYVEYPEHFTHPARFTKEMVAQIVGAPRFRRSAPEGLPWAGAYPWEKFENAAKLAEAAGQDELAIANWHLLAAWSVRLDVLSENASYSPRVRELLLRMPSGEADLSDLNALQELCEAERWIELCNARQLPGVSEDEAALAICWAYRSRGELNPAGDWLGRAALARPGLADDDTLYHYLLTSIELERGYLRSTLTWLTAAVNKGAVPASNQAGTAFLIAEINRRLGHFGEAAAWYRDAERQNLGALNPAIVARQLRAVENGRGY